MARVSSWLLSFSKSSWRSKESVEKLESAVRWEGSRSAPLCQEGLNAVALAQLGTKLRRQAGD